MAGRQQWRQGVWGQASARALLQTETRPAGRWRIPAARERSWLVGEPELAHRFGRDQPLLGREGRAAALPATGASPAQSPDLAPGGPRRTPGPQINSVDGYNDLLALADPAAGPDCNGLFLEASLGCSARCRRGQRKGAQAKVPWLAPATQKNPDQRPGLGSCDKQL